MTEKHIECLRCSQEDKINEIHKTVKALDAHIRGNGKPGLTTQMAVLSICVKGLTALCVMIVVGLIGIWLGK